METTRQTHQASSTDAPTLRDASEARRSRPLTLRLIVIILIGAWIAVHVNSGEVTAKSPVQDAAPAAVAAPAPTAVRTPEAPQPDTPQRDVYDDSQAQAR